MPVQELGYVRTGTVPGREDLLFQGGNPDVFHEVSVMPFYIRTADGVVLVDSSFSLEDARALGLAETVKRALPGEDPVRALENVGIALEDVTKLILTHAHYDHIGYADAFPNARVFIHRKELAWVMALPAWSPGYGGFTVAKLTRIRDRLVPIETDRFTVAPGVQTVYWGGHSPGSLAVVVEARKGRVCLCGDNCFLYKNIEEKIPIGLTNNLYESMAVLEQLPLLGDMHIPGHDPRVHERYPTGVIA